MKNIHFENESIIKALRLCGMHLHIAHARRVTIMTDILIPHGVAAIPEVTNSMVGILAQLGKNPGQVYNTHGGKTVVVAALVPFNLVDDDSLIFTAESECSEKDVFSRNRGLGIALRRLLSQLRDAGHLHYALRGPSIAFIPTALEELAKKCLTMTREAQSRKALIDQQAKAIQDVVAPKESQAAPAAQG
jgi:hypothetical protein